MPHLGPISRRELISNLKQLGFEGPYSGAKHQIMRKGDITITIPNPHRGDIGVGFVTRILRHAGIEKSEWEKL
ncbi:MAG: type II toxin-antitoxin system HicA family toxin [Acidobacteria bacterium]|nr:type II toxin-antitoxin system HicA family toxin [Acidobacteriota bacterium]